VTRDPCQLSISSALFVSLAFLACLVTMEPMLPRQDEGAAAAAGVSPPPVKAHKMSTESGSAPLPASNSTDRRPTDLLQQDNASLAISQGMRFRAHPSPAPAPETNSDPHATSLPTPHQPTSNSTLQRELVVDGLNLMRSFLPIADRDLQGNAPQIYAEAHVRIQEFKLASESSNMRVIFVFDNGQTSREAKEKWQRRRLEEVRKEQKQVPVNSSHVFRTLLEREGFTVYSPKNIDGDDAVAKLAKMNGADILSQDKDMLRYGTLARLAMLSDSFLGTRSTNFLSS
jgi:hypothetical protein